jgi:hypothetical protein
MSDRSSDRPSAVRPARTRAIALIGVPDERRAPHTASFPLDPAKMLPDADVVLLVADDDPGAMLFRYSAYGEMAGDTWHPSVADARVQAGEEYGDALQPWVEVPTDVADAHHFAVRYAAERLNDREGR